MFNRVIAIIIVSALLGSGFSRFFVYAGFQLNQKYIAQNLCINKSRPWLHCNGRCYFMRKMKQAEEDDRKQDARDNLNRLSVSFFEQPFSIAFITPKTIAQVKPHGGFYKYSHSSSYLAAIFRPPKALV